MYLYSLHASPVRSASLAPHMGVMGGWSPASFPFPHSLHPITTTYCSYKMPDNVLIQSSCFTSKISLISPSHGGDVQMVPIVPLPTHSLHPITTTYCSYKMPDNVLIQSSCFTSKISLISPMHRGDGRMVPSIVPLPTHSLHPITTTDCSYEMSDNVLIQPPRFTSKISLISPSHGGDGWMSPASFPFPHTHCIPLQQLTVAMKCLTMYSYSLHAPPVRSASLAPRIGVMGGWSPASFPFPHTHCIQLQQLTVAMKCLTMYSYSLNASPVRSASLAPCIRVIGGWSPSSFLSLGLLIPPSRISLTPPSPFPPTYHELTAFHYNNLP